MLFLESIKITFYRDWFVFDVLFHVPLPSSITYTVTGATPLSLFSQQDSMYVLCGSALVMDLFVNRSPSLIIHQSIYLWVQLSTCCLTIFFMYALNFIDVSIVESESIVPTGSTMTGLNIYLSNSDPIAQPHNQYPEWLWTLTDSYKQQQKQQEMEHANTANNQMAAVVKSDVRRLRKSHIKQTNAQLAKR
jgi:hypothetical protein